MRVPSAAVSARPPIAVYCFVCFAFASFAAWGCRPEPTATTVPVGIHGQPEEQDWRQRIVVPVSGETRSFEELLDELAEFDFVLVGETHLDAETHRVELDLLMGLSRRKPGQVTLSLEMFRREVQPALDAYLDDAIDEAAFRSQSDPWPNYVTDYRPLVEFAKKRGIPVVAANLPLTLQRKFGSQGEKAMDELTPTERALMPATVFPPEPAYWARLERELRDMGHGNSTDTTPEQRRYSVQNLWDNTMADSAHRAWEPGRTVIHVAGAFHVEQGLGIPAQLRKRSADAKIATVTVRAVSDLAALELEAQPEHPSADYAIYVSALARGPSGGELAVRVPHELRYRLFAPEVQVEPLPLLIWLAPDGARIDDVLTYWRWAVGERAIIVVPEPLHRERQPDLRVAGRWSWPDTAREDAEPVIEGIESILEYLAPRYAIDRSRLVIGGEGTGATQALLAGLHGTEADVAVVALEPSRAALFAEAPLSEGPPKLRQAEVIASTPAWTELGSTLAESGIETRHQGAEATAEDRQRLAGTTVRQLLRVPEDSAITVGETFTVTVDSPLARQWADLFTEAHRRRGVAVSVRTGADTTSLTVDPSILANAKTLPLPPGAFGGTTVIVLDASATAAQFDAWKGVQASGVIQQQNRFGKLIVTREDDVTAALEEIRHAGRRLVMIVPAEFVVDAKRMQSLAARIEGHEEGLSIHWLPGLGSALAHAIAKGIPPTPGP